jgi:hypothetical protein
MRIPLRFVSLLVVALCLVAAAPILNTLHAQQITSAVNYDVVLRNGTQVLKDGEHTGATPGRVVRGPGYKGQ